MSKYINAEELKSQIAKATEDEYSAPLDEYIDGLRQKAEEIIDIIDEMPGADVVEVVRCKDCEFGIENGELCGRKVYLCSCMTNPNEFYGDFYCAGGERKEIE